MAFEFTVWLLFACIFTQSEQWIIMILGWTKNMSNKNQALAKKCHPHFPLWPDILEFYFVTLPAGFPWIHRNQCVHFYWSSEFAYQRNQKKRHFHCSQSIWIEFICLCKNLAHKQCIRIPKRTELVQCKTEISCSFGNFY